MNAKYMAVFATVIMFAGCASVLAYADDAEVDAASEKTVYVLKDETAQVKIKQTLNALNSYSNTIAWTYGNGTAMPTSDPGTSNGTAVTFWMDYNTEEIEEGKGVPTDFTLNVEGNSVTSSAEEISLKMTISSKVTQADTKPLVQILEYKIKVNVLPSTFTVEDVEAVPNQVAVGTDGYLVPTYSGITNTANSPTYLFYAVGLPDGVAMDSAGKISGTPNVTDWSPVDGKVDVTGTEGSRVATYNVTVYATHIASNLVIKDTLTFSVSETSDDFTIKVTAGTEGGDYLKETPDGGYKSIGNNELKVTINVMKEGVEYNIYYINETDGVQTLLGKIPNNGSVTEFTFTPEGTGEFTIVATNGSTVKSVSLIVVEPVEDIQTGIAFQPGSYVN